MTFSNAHDTYKQRRVHASWSRDVLMFSFLGLMYTCFFFFFPHTIKTFIKHGHELIYTIYKKIILFELNFYVVQKYPH